jgi:ABC-type amino acid transport substrate-binding protein
MTGPFASRRIFIAMGLSASAALLVACSDKKLAFNAIDISGAEMGQDFAISDHNGQLRKLADFAGKVVVVFFGYTQVPGRLSDHHDRAAGGQAPAGQGTATGCSPYSFP